MTGTGSYRNRGGGAGHPADRTVPTDCFNSIVGSGERGAVPGEDLIGAGIDANRGSGRRRRGLRHVGRASVDEEEHVLEILDRDGLGQGDRRKASDQHRRND